MGLRSVLEQTGRVLQALVDVTADCGYLSAALQVMRLSQVPRPQHSLPTPVPIAIPPAKLHCRPPDDDVVAVMLCSCVIMLS